MSTKTSFAMTLAMQTEHFEQMRKSIIEQGKVHFSKALAGFFEQFPEVQTIYWTQYTPYFNDGEPCEFEINEIEFSKKHYSEIQSPYDDEDALEIKVFDYVKKMYVNNPELSSELISAIEAIRDFMSRNNDTMHALFDDGVFVRAHTNGIEVDEYDHE